MTPRAANAHAQVNAAFLAQVDPATFECLSRPSLVFGGASLDPDGHAAGAEAAMVAVAGGSFADESFLRTALAALEAEVDPEEDPVAAPADYRKHLTKALLYKVVIYCTLRTLVTTHFIIELRPEIVEKSVKFSCSFSCTSWATPPLRSCKAPPPKSPGSTVPAL